MAQQRRREVTEDDGHDRLAMQEQVRAKDKRINQLEEAKYRLEEENAAMAKKLEELQVRGRAKLSMKNRENFCLLSLNCSWTSSARTLSAAPSPRGVVAAPSPTPPTPTPPTLVLIEDRADFQRQFVDCELLEWLGLKRRVGGGPR